MSKAMLRFLRCLRWADRLLTVPAACLTSVSTLRQTCSALTSI